MITTSIILVGIMICFSTPIITLSPEPKVLDRLGCSGYCHDAWCPYSSPGTIVILPCKENGCFNVTGILYNTFGKKFNEKMFEVKEVSYCRYSPYFSPNSANGTIICEVPGHVIPAGCYRCQTGSSHTHPYSSNIHVFHDYDLVMPKMDENEPVTYIWGGNIAEIITVILQHNCPSIKRLQYISCSNVNSIRNGVKHSNYLQVQGIQSNTNYKNYEFLFDMS